MKETVEEKIKALLSKPTEPPPEVIIPILEKAGRGEQELIAQVYDSCANLAKGIKDILGLEDSDMKTLAKVAGFVFSSTGAKVELVELSKSKLSFSMKDCPMLHVGKNVKFDVKSKFCDLMCTGGSQAMMDTVLGPNKGICKWNKALIKGADKCTLTFELVET